MLYFNHSQPHDYMLFILYNGSNDLYGFQQIVILS